MKRLAAKTCAAALALCALAQPQLALAQDCVDQDDLAAMTQYAMPLLADAFVTRCETELSTEGFFATQGDDFLAPFRAGQDENWPATMRVLKVFGSKGGEDAGPMAMLDMLPEDALRPFVDAIVGTLVAKELKIKDCGKIERGIALLAPLPPENVGNLMSFIFDMADVKNPSVCPYKGEYGE